MEINTTQSNHQVHDLQKNIDYKKARGDAKLIETSSTRKQPT